MNTKDFARTNDSSSNPIMKNTMMELREVEQEFYRSPQYLKMKAAFEELEKKMQPSR